MRYIELFAGIGGFRKALDKAGHECVWANDIDKHAIAIYNNYYGERYEPTDIRTVKAEDIPDHEMLCGGFPCQDFSIAGKRKGFEGTRGTLFFEICRIAEAKRPKYLFLENVKGLLSHGEGRTFRRILASLDELGYDAEWQVCNSKHFGVPQNRERVFIVGVLRGHGGRKVFPLRQDDRKADTEKINKMVYKKLGKRYSNNDVAQANRAYYPEGIVTAQRGCTRTLIIPEIAGCLTGGGHSGGLHSDMTAIPVLTPDRPEKRQNGRRFKEDGEDMFTLTAQDRHGLMLRDSRDNRSCLRSGRTTEIGYKGVSIRRLTPVECYRLQGFCPRLPDGSFDDTFYEKAKEVASPTQLYKTAGNAVTVNVIEAIIRAIDRSQK